MWPLAQSDKLVTVSARLAPDGGFERSPSPRQEHSAARSITGHTAGWAVGEDQNPSVLCLWPCNSVWVCGQQVGCFRWEGGARATGTLSRFPHSLTGVSLGHCNLRGLSWGRLVSMLPGSSQLSPVPGRSDGRYPQLSGMQSKRALCLVCL